MNKIKRYKKKPVEIQAVQFTVDDRDLVAHWCAGRVVEDVSPRDRSDVRYTIAIPTLEGTMHGMVGDYIIKGVRGEFYPCKRDIFEETYEEA